MANTNETIGAIAAKDIHKAEVMKKLGIDFCCGGKKTIQQAADEAGITTDELQKALNDAEKVEKRATHHFDLWDAGFLADYIYNEHHQYFYRNKDLILQLMAKVKQVHGKDHPELTNLADSVETLFAELTDHFRKEEEELFPYIRELVKGSNKVHISTGSLSMMTMEHEIAGDILRSIRNTTHNYRVPAGGCNSFRLLYKNLEELERDLHQHIHLENNILFPKVLAFKDPSA